MGKVWVAPQGWAAPQAAVQSELNDVPEMQHWPGGNDMPKGQAEELSNVATTLPSG